MIVPPTESFTLVKRLMASYPNVTVADVASLGDVLATLFNSWRGAFAALSALALAAWGAWGAIRWGKKPASQG